VRRHGLSGVEQAWRPNKSTLSPGTVVQTARGTQWDKAGMIGYPGHWNRGGSPRKSTTHNQ